jgi:SAM-dependent methyltransferase
MDEAEWRERAQSFGSVAPAYSDHRPEYPHDAVAWLVGTSPARVLELGAGTGKLTGPLLALGHDVLATDPSPQMLGQLQTAHPAARVVTAKAEDIPLPPSSVDIVVTAQAYHWFDPERALPEIARVLRPGGTFALIWNNPDRKVPWVRRVFELLGLYGRNEDDDPVEGSELFAPSDRRQFRHWQHLNRASLLGFAGSVSRVAVMEESERDKLLDDVGALYDEYGRGPDGMKLPWIAACFRTRVTGLARFGPAEPPQHDDGLLIDFS